MLSSVALRSLFALASVSVVAASACINTDAAVFVDPTVETPSITVTKGATMLGTQIDGALVLRLHLGARASGPSKVTLTALNVANADQSSFYVDNIGFTADHPSPIDVEEDSDVSVSITISTGAGLEPAALYDAICTGGNVVITGSLQDSLQTTATPFESDPIAPTCM